MIPFTKTIEEFLAALPTQARLEVKVRELAAKIESLEEENAKLKAKVAELQPKTGMDANAAKILKALFEEESKDDGELSDDQLSRRLGLHKSMVLYHLDKLMKQGLADCRPDIDAGYYITTEGRAFVIENGLT